MHEEDEASKPLSDAQLWCLILRSWNAVHRLRQLELTESGITVEQSSVLTALRYCGGAATSDELEDITLRQQHSISALTNRMIKSGLVIKEKSPKERKSRVAITEYGQQVLENTRRDAVTPVFSCLEQSEKAEFAAYLHALREKVRDLLGTAYRPPFMQAIAAENAEKVNFIPEGNFAKVSDYNLWIFLDGAGFAMSRLRQLELSKFGLTVEQSIVMMILRHRGGSITANKVGELTFRQHNSISALVNRMIKAGLIAREKKPGEKSSTISLTREGHDLFNRLTYVSLEMVFSTLKPNERLDFIRYLNTVHDKARELLGFSRLGPALEKVG